MHYDDFNCIEDVDVKEREDAEPAENLDTPWQYECVAGLRVSRQTLRRNTHNVPRIRPFVSCLD